jgi:hypothetical protein
MVLFSKRFSVSKTIALLQIWNVCVQWSMKKVYLWKRCINKFWLWQVSQNSESKIVILFSTIVQISMHYFVSKKVMTFSPLKSERSENFYFIDQNLLSRLKFDMINLIVPQLTILNVLLKPLMLLQVDLQC